MPLTVAIFSDSQRCCHAPPGRAFASSTTKVRHPSAATERDGDRHEAAPPQVVSRRESRLSRADDDDVDGLVFHAVSNTRRSSVIPASTPRVAA